VQDEDNAPLDGSRYELKVDERDTLNEMNDPNQDGCVDDGTGKSGACPIPATVDEKSSQRGMEPEIVTIAVACDRVLAVSCGENNGDCFLYDVTDLPNPPVLKQVFQLSPVSKTMAPGPAYESRTLGDLDPEATFFAPADKSPTGRPGIFFGGAHSGTMSWWEFECTSPVAAVERNFGSSSSSSSLDNQTNDLSTGAIVGIVLGTLAFLILITMIIKLWRKKPEQIIIDGSKTHAIEDA
jgi:hypothetical protein